MVDGDYLLLSLLIIYCSISLFIFTKRLIYFIRCIRDSNFRKKTTCFMEKSNYTRYDFINHIHMVTCNYY